MFGIMYTVYSVILTESSITFNPHETLDKTFGTYHTSKQMAAFSLRLYGNENTPGIVDREIISI